MSEVKIDSERLKTVQIAQTITTEHSRLSKNARESCDEMATEKLARFLLGEGAIQVDISEHDGESTIFYTLEVVMPKPGEYTILTSGARL